MKLNSLTSAAAIKAASTTATIAIAPTATKATATIAIAPTTAKPATTKAPATTVPATVVSSKPASTVMQVKTKIQHCKEQKKYGNFTIEELMPMMDKIYIGLKHFEKAVDKLWMKQNVIDMDQHDLFSTFYSLSFFEKLMSEDIASAMFNLEDCVKELVSIKDNYDLIYDFIDPKITKEMEQVYSLL